MTLDELRKPFENIIVDTHGEFNPVGNLQAGVFVTAVLGGETLTVTAASEKDALNYFLETYPPLKFAVLDKPALTELFEPITL